jgi:hypothetical protein
MKYIFEDADPNNTEENRQYLAKVLANKNVTKGNTIDLRGSGVLTLHGCPDHIKGDFYCGVTGIKYLEGGPTRVDGFYEFEDTPNIRIKSLRGAPKFIGRGAELGVYGLKTLTGFYKYFPEIHGNLTILDVRRENKSVTNVLSLFMVKGLTSVNLANIPPEAHDILNTYLAKGKTGLLSCKSELIKAGFEELAKL